MSETLNWGPSNHLHIVQDAFSSLTLISTNLLHEEHELNTLVFLNILTL